MHQYYCTVTETPAIQKAPAMNINLYLVYKQQETSIDVEAQLLLVMPPLSTGHYWL